MHPSFQEPVYPTESRELAKERKKAGHVPCKRPKTVEDHFDDLGDDLAGLGGDMEYHAADTVVANSSFFFLLFRSSHRFCGRRVIEPADSSLNCSSSNEKTLVPVLLVSLFLQV